MIIVLIIVAIAFCLISYKLGQKTVQVEKERENEIVRQINSKLDEDYNKKQLDICNAVNKLEELNQKIDQKTKEHNHAIEDLTITYKAVEADYMLREAEMSHRLDLVKDDKFSKINRAATRYREKMYEEVQADTKAAMEVAQKTKDTLIEECNKIGIELTDLIAQRDALLEANRKNEETKLQANFYKIILTPNELEDIKLLLSIERFLNNKDPLYKLIWNNFYMTPTKDMLNRIIGKEKTSGIYKITNQTNQKVYIGQSVDLHGRLTNHIKAALGIGTIAHQTVHDAMAADGIENFTFEIIDRCPKDQLNKKEKLWIETYASNKYGYNRTAGGAKEE